MNKLLEEKYAKEIEKQITDKNYETLRYALFNKENNIPWSTHLYFENDYFYVNSRDDRGYIIGKTWKYSNFDDATKGFMNILDETVKGERMGVELGIKPNYASPLWDN